MTTNIRWLNTPGLEPFCSRANRMNSIDINKKKLQKKETLMETVKIEDDNFIYSTYIQSELNSSFQLNLTSLHSLVKIINKQSYLRYSIFDKRHKSHNSDCNCIAKVVSNVVNNRCHLISLAVASGYQYETTAMIKKLMSLLLQKLIKNNVTELTVNIPVCNDAQLQLFERLGFIKYALDGNEAYALKLCVQNSEALEYENNEIKQMDKEKMSKIKELMSENETKASKRCNIDSNYLLNASNIYCLMNQCKHHHAVKRCVSLIRIARVLKKYHLYVAEHQRRANSNDTYLNIDNVYDNYNNICLLNDYNHLLFCHPHQFEDIYEVLIKKS
eukprot:148815_1